MLSYQGGRVGSPPWRPALAQRSAAESCAALRLLPPPAAAPLARRRSCFPPSRCPQHSSCRQCCATAAASLPFSSLFLSCFSRSIVGAIGSVDAFQLPDAKGYTALSRFILDISDEERQTRRRVRVGVGRRRVKTLKTLNPVGRRPSGCSQKAAQRPLLPPLVWWWWIYFLLPHCLARSAAACAATQVAGLLQCLSSHCCDAAAAGAPARARLCAGPSPLPAWRPCWEPTAPAGTWRHVPGSAAGTQFVDWLLINRSID